MDLIVAEKLRKNYGHVHALKGIHVAVSEGITGFLGPNGAGKSTAIRLFLGLSSPSSGSVSLFHMDPSSHPEARYRIGYMPEHQCLPENETAATFVAHMGEMSGIPSKHARSRSADALRHSGILEERYRPIKDYSMGMRQRIKLAQAIVHDPTLILLDEPTAGLDPNGRREMLELLRRIHSEFGISILITSHLLRDVEIMCDRVIVIEGGEITRSETVAKLTEKRKVVSVEVLRNQKKFVQLLVERGLEVSQGEKGTVEVKVMNGETYDVIRDALVTSGAPLLRMAAQQGDLADIFR